MSLPGRRLYLGRIPPDCQREDLDHYFGKYGRVIDIRIMNGGAAGGANSFGFLEYEALRDAEDAVHDLNGREFMGERLIVEYAKAPRPRDDYYGPPRGYGGDRGGFDRGGGGYGAGGGGGGGRRGGGFRLTVRGFGPETSWQDLKDFARAGGNVMRADVDRSTGEGMIEFGTQEEATEAARKLDGTDLKGVVVTVTEDRAGGAPAPSGGGSVPPPRDYGRRDRSRSPRRDYDDRDRGGDRYDRRRSPPPRERDYDRRDRSPPRNGW